MKKDAKWTPLHHAVWRELKKIFSSRDLERKHFLLCVSGGADSVSLFHIMRELPVRVSVFHAHHGEGENAVFRNQAEEFVRSLCLEHKISFHAIWAEKDLRSEDDFRKFRREFFKNWCSQNPQGVVVMAHHSQDLLETRMMRLIRGTAREGLIAMKIWKSPVLRPFLETDPQALRSFLQSKGWKWVEDPSNQNPRYFRNWLRTRWLPLLEKARPGSLKRLGLSLENLVTKPSSQRPPLKMLNRADYLGLNQKEQLQELAWLLKSHGVTQFTTGQLKEIQKRLDNGPKRLMFEIAGARWIVNAERILMKTL